MLSNIPYIIFQTFLYQTIILWGSEETCSLDKNVKNNVFLIFSRHVNINEGIQSDIEDIMSFLYS